MLNGSKKRLIAGAIILGLLAFLAWAVINRPGIVHASTCARSGMVRISTSELLNSKYSEYPAISRLASELTSLEIRSLGVLSQPAKSWKFDRLSVTVSATT
jgi:hypothetical protein